MDTFFLYKKKKIQRVQWKTSNNFAWFVSKEKWQRQIRKGNQREKEVKTNSTGLICKSVKLNQVIIICVVTFKIRHKVLNTVLRNWAMFGNCSQWSFVKTNLLEELKVEGTKTVTDKILNGDCKRSSLYSA